MNNVEDGECSKTSTEATRRRQRVVMKKRGWDLRLLDAVGLL
jgi:hypothetical protein